MSVYFSNTINSYSSAYGKDKTIVAGKIVDSIANKNVFIAPDGVNKRFELSDTQINFKKII